MRFLCVLGLTLFTTSVDAETLVYFGTYTRGNSVSEGIYVSTLNETSGALSPPKLAAAVTNPSFVAVHPNGRFLYAVSEVFEDGEKLGGAIAFSINNDGTLTKLNEQSSGGAGACHVAVDPSGRVAAVANYGGGSCASFPINEDGSLGERASFHQHIGGSGVNAKRQKGPHAHSVNFNSDGMAVVADLGLDQILMYNVDAETGAMTSATPPFVATPPGGGPRHFSFAPSGQIAFANLELTSAIIGLSAGPALEIPDSSKPVSTLPEDVRAEFSQPGRNSTAECLVHPTLPSVYVSNRGHNSIAHFRFDRNTAALEFIGTTSSGGDIPRGFGISPDGNFLVVGNQKTDNVITLKVDSETGNLSPTGYELSIGSPVNVRFLKR